MSRFILPFLLFSALLLTACAGEDKDETAGMSARELFEQAEDALYANEFSSAVDYLESLEARYPFDRYAKQAQLNIAYAYYKFEELDQAYSAAERFIRLHPRSRHLDYVYYLKGLINFSRGEGLLDAWFPRQPYKHDPAVLENAFNDFAMVVRRFPDSPYAGDAYQRMIYLRNQMARKEIDIAEFYMKRGTWLSSARRAQTVIERYPQTRWVKRALEILRESYEKLDLAQLAADTQKVIDANAFNQTSNAVNPDTGLPPPPRTTDRAPTLTPAAGDRNPT